MVLYCMCVRVYAHADCARVYVRMNIMWFKKKATAPSSPAPPECNHKYKDFDWYMECTYFNDTKTYVIDVYEPYVCILCRHRKNVLLHRVTGNGWDSFKNYRKVLKNTYPKVKDRAFVEDEIADMQLLDPYYLEAYYKLYPERKVANYHDD